MSRFLVPGALTTLIAAIGLGLIVGIVARSPETHANVWPIGYDRLPIAYVGETSGFSGVGLAAEPTSADQVERGGLLFIGYGCATCHGLAGSGGVVGPELDLAKLELWLDDFRAALRAGPGGMPAFTGSVLDDDDLDAIYAYLKAIRQSATVGADDSTP